MCFVNTGIKAILQTVLNCAATSKLSDMRRMSCANGDALLELLDCRATLCAARFAFKGEDMVAESGERVFDVPMCKEG